MNDEPRFEPAGDFLTVSGLLAALRVADASIEERRAAVHRVAGLASVRPWIDRLLPELRRRRLV